MALPYKASSLGPNPFTLTKIHPKHHHSTQRTTYSASARAVPSTWSTYAKCCCHASLLKHTGMEGMGTRASRPLVQSALHCSFHLYSCLHTLSAHFHLRSGTKKLLLCSSKTKGSLYSAGEYRGLQAYEPQDWVSETILFGQPCSCQDQQHKRNAFPRAPNPGIVYAAAWYRLGIYGSRLAS